MAMRTVHKPQLFLNFLTAHHDGLEAHGQTKLPPLKENQVVNLSDRLSFFSHGFKKTGGRRFMTKKQSIKMPVLSRVLKFMYICD